MSGHRALVTGATGFVGACVVRRLLAEGWIVHALAREGSRSDGLPVGNDRFELHTVRPEASSMRCAVRKAKPDVVLHLASRFVSRHSPEDLRPLVESNVAFGALLLDAMGEAGCSRFINTGTGWQHYAGAEYSAVNLYAATKQAFEALLDFYIAANGVRAITLELHDTYGPQDPRGKFLGLLLDAARTGRELPASPGEQRLDLVHVDDVAGAFVHAARMSLDDAGPARHSRYRVSSGRAITLRQLVKELERAIGCRVPVAWGALAYRPREMMRPSTRYEVLPGWTPQVPLAAGLKSLA